MVGNGPRQRTVLSRAHSSMERPSDFMPPYKNAADSEVAFPPEHMSRCSGKIYLSGQTGNGRRVHHPIRHTFREETGNSGKYSSALPVCIPRHAGKNLL